MLKGLSNTRWSFKALALKALISQFRDVLELLETMVDPENDGDDTVSGAKNFLKNLKAYEFVILLVFGPPF